MKDKIKKIVAIVLIITGTLEFASGCAIARKMKGE